MADRAGDTPVAIMVANYCCAVPDCPETARLDTFLREYGVQA